MQIKNVKHLISLATASLVIVAMASQGDYLKGWVDLKFIKGKEFLCVASSFWAMLASNYITIKQK